MRKIKKETESFPDSTTFGDDIKDDGKEQVTSGSGEVCGVDADTGAVDPSDGIGEGAGEEGFSGESSLMNLDFRHAKRLLKDKKNVGLKLVKDKRHVTISWHQSGRVKEALEKIFDASLNQFRQQLKGVPLAIGKLKVPKYGGIIASQSCMHMDVTADTILFQPKSGKIYRCVVTSVEKDYLTARLFGAISFVASIKNVEKKPNFGDEVNIRGKVIPDQTW